MRKLAMVLCLAVLAGLFVCCAAGCGRSGGKPGSNVLDVQVGRPELQEGSDDVQQGGLPGRNDGADGNGGSPTVSYGDHSGLEDAELRGFALKAPEELLISAKISGIPGSYKLSYTHPEVPQSLHFSVSLRIYEEGPEGDLLRESYDSDGAWMADPSAYDPHARTVEIPLAIKTSLSDKYVLLSAKCFGSSISTYSAAAIHDYDGTISGGFEGVFAWSR